MPNSMPQLRLSEIRQIEEGVFVEFLEKKAIRLYYKNKIFDVGGEIRRKHPGFPPNEDQPWVYGFVIQIDDTSSDSLLVMYRWTCRGERFNLCQGLVQATKPEELEPC